MANFDKPAFLWIPISKTFDQDAAINDTDIPSISDPVWVAQWQNADNAFDSVTGGGGGPASYPIGG